MPGAQITAPKGGYSKISDFTTYLDADGHRIPYAGNIEFFRCNAAVSKFDVVGFVIATTSVPLSVTPIVVATATAPLTMTGVAQKAGAVGDIIPVMTTGVTLAHVDTSDPVFGDVVIKGASNGTCATGGTIGGTWDGTKVAGTAWGIFLDVDTDPGSGPDLAPVYLFRF